MVNLGLIPLIARLRTGSMAKFTVLVDDIGYLDLNVDDPASNRWTGRAYGGHEAGLLSFTPGVLRLRIVNGALSGREATAVLRVDSGHAVLIGEGPFG
ncbi:MAG: hypothetical protein JWL73_1152 [Actinomycetia bacterium]|nr:hypothetical protein [Actinomycetes bacterium]